MKEFKFRDKVKVTQGFFEGQRGLLVDTGKRRYVNGHLFVDYKLQLEDMGGEVWVDNHSLELIDN